MESLRPGDLMFGPIGGFVPGVLPVGAGQWLLADRKARLSWRQWWHLRHVGVVVEASEHIEGPAMRLPSGEYRWITEEDPPNDELEALGAEVYRTGVITAPRMVQAMPPGAEEIDMSEQKHWTDDHVYVRPAYRLDESHTFESELTAKAARRYVGTPYGFLDYVAILGVHLGIKDGRIRRRVRDSGHMICSQLADQAMADAGFHVFDDGRLPQDVVPAELFRALMAMPDTLHLHPGGDVWTLASRCAHL